MTSAQPLTVAELAERQPETFSALAAMRIAALLAVRSGGLERLQVETERGAAQPLADVASLRLSGQPEVSFTFGLHSHPIGRGLLHPRASASLVKKADEIDRALHWSRYLLWISQAYPSLARELMMACPPAERAALTAQVPGSALQPLADTLRLLSGAPAEAISDGELLECGAAIVARNAAALEDLLSDEFGAPVQALPPDDAAQVRLQIGPLPWSGYVALLPIGARHGLRRLLQRVSLVAGAHVDAEITLVLDRQALPARHKPGELGHPQWTMFPCGKQPPQNDPRVVISAALCRETLHPRPAAK